LLLFRWWHEYIADLLLSHPGWEQQETINLHFIRRIDHETINEIAIEINAHAEQVRRIVMVGSSNFEGRSCRKSFHPRPFMSVGLLNSRYAKPSGQGAICQFLVHRDVRLRSSLSISSIGQIWIIAREARWLPGSCLHELSLGGQGVACLRACHMPFGVSKLDSLYDTESIDKLATRRSEKPSSRATPFGSTPAIPPLYRC